MSQRSDERRTARLAVGDEARRRRLRVPREVQRRPGQVRPVRHRLRNACRDGPARALDVAHSRRRCSTRRRAARPRRRSTSETRRSAADEDAVLELRHVDFSYGKVQVLFGVDLAVRPRRDASRCSDRTAPASRRCCASISGLNRPDRGTVTLHGERRSLRQPPNSGCGCGIVQLIGGEATFPAADGRREPARRRVPVRPAGGQGPRRPRARPVPDARSDRRDTRRRDLSGGQQHMLALAIALMHDPEVLLIDELSLGLAPVVVQQVLDVVRDAQAARADDGARRAVARRRARHRGPRRVHGEGRDPLRRDRAASSRLATISCAPCSSAAPSVTMTRASRSTSRSRSCSRAS